MAIKNKCVKVGLFSIELLGKMGSNFCVGAGRSLRPVGLGCGGRKGFNMWRLGKFSLKFMPTSKIMSLSTDWMQKPI